MHFLVDVAGVAAGAELVAVRRHDDKAQTQVRPGESAFDASERLWQEVKPPPRFMLSECIYSSGEGKP